MVLEEPRDFLLRDGVSLAYRPVMHRLIGSPYDEPLDAFWGRVYRALAVPDSAVFPMVTPGDRQTIRPYFNAGLLIVRPERGLLRAWAEAFRRLYEDAVLVQMGNDDSRKRVFLHQAALTGAILSKLTAQDLLDLPDRYNYPIFFHERYEAARTFDSIEGIATLRHDVYFRNPAPGWSDRLKGPADKIQWLRQRLGSRPSPTAAR